MSQWHMSHLHDDKIKFLEETANRIRQDVIESVVNAGSGHVAGLARSCIRSTMGASGCSH